MSNKLRNHILREIEPLALLIGVELYWFGKYMYMNPIGNYTVDSTVVVQPQSAEEARRLLAKHFIKS